MKDRKTATALSHFARAGKWEVQWLSALTPIYILVITAEKVTQKQQEYFVFRAGLEYEGEEQYFWDICKKGKKRFLMNLGKGQPIVIEIPVPLQSPVIPTAFPTSQVKVLTASRQDLRFTSHLSCGSSEHDNAQLTQYYNTRSGIIWGGNRATSGGTNITSSAPGCSWRALTY